MQLLSPLSASTISPLKMKLNTPKLLWVESKKISSLLTKTRKSENLQSIKTKNLNLLMILVSIK